MQPEKKKRSRVSSEAKEEEPKKILKSSLMLPQDKSALSERELHNKLEQAKEMNQQVQYHINLLFEKLGIKPDQRQEFMAKLAKQSPDLFKLILEEKRKWAELTGAVSGKNKPTEKKSDPDRGRKSLKLRARNQNWISMR